MKYFNKKIASLLIMVMSVCVMNLSAATDVDNDNSGTQGSQESAKQAIDTLGKVTAVWQSLNSFGNSVIQAATKSAGQTTWSASTGNPISGNGGSGSTLNATSPIIAVNVNGYVVAVWFVEDSSATVPYIAAATKSSGSSSWTNLSRLTTTTETPNQDYQVVIDDNIPARITVTWSSIVVSTDTFTRIRSATSNNGGSTWS